VMDLKCIGDATEVALLRCMKALSIDVVGWRERCPKVAEIPFNSVNKFQVSIHEYDDKGHVLLMKGAPERVFARCNTMLVGEDTLQITPEMREQYMEAYRYLGSRGERVIGLADFHLGEGVFTDDVKLDVDDVDFDGLRFVGLVSMIDPPREGVAEAVEECRSASIKVVMITGDHPITAKAIARQVGIITLDTVLDVSLRRGIPVGEVSPCEVGAAVVHADKLRKMTYKQLRKMVAEHEELVFARTSPQQKLLIVKSFQSIGHIVAVTGDGVNDSPALKQADIGIAMGITGSEVSKEAADMVLLDDDFSSIVKGVKEGRVIFDNLKKSIAYTLTSNMPELLPFLAFMLLGIPLPLSTLAIFCIDLGTDMLPAISLAYEKPENDIMRRTPRNPQHDRLVNWRLLMYSYMQIGMIQVAAGFFSYFAVMADNGFFPADLFKARIQWYHPRYIATDRYNRSWSFSQRRELESLCHTAYFVSIVIAKWANLLISKTRRSSLFRQGMRNMCLNFSLFFMTLLAYLLTVVPGVSLALGMYPLKLSYWLAPIPFAIIIFLYDEIRKWFIRRFPGGWVERVTYY